MALQKAVELPSGAAFPAAYEWAAAITFDFAAGDYSLTMNVHPDAESADAGKPPIAQSVYFGGQSEPGPDGVTIAMPTGAQVMTDLASEFAAIKAYLYGKLAAMPSQAGATQVS
jgi:hypothetical protein